MVPHIGKKIKEELYRQRMSVGEFAKKINRSRQVAYNIFERESVDTELLSKIGAVLDYDFFSLFESVKTEKIPETQVKIKDEKLALLEQRVKFLEIEIQYLKKLNSLLESQSENRKKKTTKSGRK